MIAVKCCSIQLQIHARAPTASPVPSLESRGDARDDPLSGGDAWPHECRGLGCDARGDKWSAPRELTSSVKRPHWTWYATGPGVGIQLAQSGRFDFEIPKK